MAERTKIAYADSTLSPWTGCSKVSPGCQNCYSERLARRYGWAEWGAGKPRHQFSGFRNSAMAMNRTAYWNLCQKCSITPCPPPRVFPSLMDWLDPDAPQNMLASFIDVVAQTTYLTWLLLTKRPELFAKQVRMAWESAAYDQPGTLHAADILLGEWMDGNPPPNVWVGTSVESQDQDYRVSQLLKIPAKVHFISHEPLLGPFSYTEQGVFYPIDAMGDIDWVIVGGETGPGARPMDVEWARSLRDQCQTAGVPFWFKQHGGKMHGKPGDDLLDGRDWKELPKI